MQPSLFNRRRNDRCPHKTKTHRLTMPTSNPKKRSVSFDVCATCASVWSRVMGVKVERIKETA